MTGISKTHIHMTQLYSVHKRLNLDIQTQMESKNIKKIFYTHNNQNRGIVVILTSKKKERFEARN